MGSEARHRSTLEMWRIRKEQPMLERIGKTGIGFMLHSERLRSAVASRVAAKVGAEAVLGFGCEQIVIPDGNGVIKYLFNKTHSEQRTAEAEAETLQRDTDRCADYLGEFWLSTEFDTTRLSRGGYGIIARQKRLVDLTSYDSTLQIAASGETRELAVRINELHEATGLYPDLLGIGNVALRGDTGRLCQIDTIPVSPETQASVTLGSSLTIAEHLEERIAAWAA